jgi:hypothetical protein
MNDSLDNDLKELEAHLSNLNPSEMPSDMLRRMENAMISWETHLPVEEKIVPFDQSDTRLPTTANPVRSNNKLQAWGAAAAIALLASVAAVFNTDDNPQSPAIAQTQPSPAIALDNRPAENITPALSRNITHASNEGITFAGKEEAPFKVLRVEYTEKVTTHDENGNPIVTEKPCVEHVLIPVPVH